MVVGSELERLWRDVKDVFLGSAGCWADNVAGSYKEQAMGDLLNNADAIYAEHPFLEEIFPRREAALAFVERWDDDLLSRFGYGRCHLLDQNGKVVATIGHRLELVDVLLGRAGTVSETLARIGAQNRQRVRYAVFAGYNEGGFGVLTLYKLPKGFENADTWFESRIAESRKALRAFS